MTISQILRLVLLLLIVFFFVCAFIGDICDHLHLSISNTARAQAMINEHARTRWHDFQIPCTCHTIRTCMTHKRFSAAFQFRKPFFARSGVFVCECDRECECVSVCVYRTSTAPVIAQSTRSICLHSKKSLLSNRLLSFFLSQTKIINSIKISFIKTCTYVYHLNHSTQWYDSQIIAINFEKILWRGNRCFFYLLLSSMRKKNVWEKMECFWKFHW